MRPVRFCTLFLGLGGLCTLFLGLGGLCVAVFPAAAPAQGLLVGDSTAEGFRPGSSRPVAKAPVVKIGAPYKAGYSRTDRRLRRPAQAKGVCAAKGHKAGRK